LSATEVTEVGQGLASGLSGDNSEKYDRIEAVAIAGRCLINLSQYEDCLSLLQPLIHVADDESSAAEITRLLSAARTAGALSSEIVPTIASLYLLAGRCYDQLEHRARARRALLACVRLDSTQLEAAEYLVDNGLLTVEHKQKLLSEVTAACSVKEVQDMYTLLLARGASQQLPELQAAGGATWAARCAELHFQQHRIDEAYRLARHAYSLDPYNSLGLAIYIGCLVALRLKSELFYLGHELVNSAPKSALSWYAVGSYYWCCNKLELAHKHLLKATKLDKRQARVWVLLGHVLSAQEESEQAISAYRTASRLLPEDHRPMAHIAKELARTNHLAPALHMLSAALDLAPAEPGLLNDLAVTYMRQGSMDLALQFFERAVHAVDASLSGAPHAGGDALPLDAGTACPPSIQSNFGGSRGAEVSIATPDVCCGSSSIVIDVCNLLQIFSNYAAALRKCERFDEALHWYDKAMSAQPNDANCHAAVGYTFHLMQR
jgi:anaphase-promoting complex subunit 6